jgi:hypothetical protein
VLISLRLAALLGMVFSAWLVGYTATSSLGFADRQSVSGKVGDKRSGQLREWP